MESKKRNFTESGLSESLEEKNRKTSNSSSKAALGKAADSTQTHAVTGDSSQYVNDRTIYVEGIPFTSSEEDVANFFKSCGEIISIRLPKWHDSGNLKGYGHIEFKNSKCASQALELTGQYLGNRYVTVDRPMQPRILQSVPETNTSSKVISEENLRKLKNKPPGCRKIFIKNLPYDITEEKIKNSFMIYGPITNIRLASWGHTNNKKGFGYIDFKREDSAEIAVKKSGSVTIEGRVITCDFEGGDPKGSFKGNSKYDKNSKPVKVNKSKNKI
eukprot:gene11291-15148_t